MYEKNKGYLGKVSFRFPSLLPGENMERKNEMLTANKKEE